MKYLHNPTTGEIRHTTPLDGKRLARYGWRYVTKAEWIEYTRAQVQAAMLRHVPKARQVLGRMQ